MVKPGGVSASGVAGIFEVVRSITVTVYEARLVQETVACSVVNLIMMVVAVVMVVGVSVLGVP